MPICIEGMNIQGEDVRETLSLNLGDAQPEPRERLRAAGLTVVPLGDELTIGNVGFGTPAQRIGLEPGFNITAVVVPTPGRPAAGWVYVPALLLAGLVWLNQRRRAGPALAEPRPEPSLRADPTS